MALKNYKNKCLIISSDGSSFISSTTTPYYKLYSKDYKNTNTWLNITSTINNKKKLNEKISSYRNKHFFKI